MDYVSISIRILDIYFHLTVLLSAVSTVQFSASYSYWKSANSILRKSQVDRLQSNQAKTGFKYFLALSTLNLTRKQQQIIAGGILVKN